MESGVLSTARELFEGRHFPSVVALVTDALDVEPECVPLLLLRARSQMALRRDLEAQADLRDIIRLEPECSLAYRFLGELAARRDENDSAAIFFGEALRLDPSDQEAETWLAIVQATARSARFAAGTQPPARELDLDSELELVTYDDDPPTSPAIRFAVGSSPEIPPYRPPQAPEESSGMRRVARHAGVFRAYPADTQDEPASQPAFAAPVPRSRPLPEAAGFGEYLVTTGILTRERLRAAQAYQRSMNVQLATAIVTLGLASPQRIEWAIVAHQSELGRR